MKIKPMAWAVSWACWYMGNEWRFAHGMPPNLPHPYTKVKDK